LPFNLAIAQIKPKKADYDHNLARLGELFAQLDREDPRADVLLLPETAMSGYFLEGGVREAARSREELYDDLLRVYRENTKGANSALDIGIGFYELAEGKYYNAGLYATLTTDDQGPFNPGICHVHHKFFLPTYGVFDEKRFVSRGRKIDAFETRFGRASLLICEDVWHSVTAMIAALEGAQIIYVISASPGREFTGEEVGNVSRWNILLPGIAEEHNVFVAYSGLVGFEGGKGFTGSSRLVDPWGRTTISAPVLEECVIQSTVDLDDVAIARAGSPMLADLEATLTDVVLELDAIARKPHCIESADNQ
jgi:predicted amidohydrolase